MTCTLGFCTIPDTRTAAAEAFRVPRPGGQLLLLEHVRSPSPIVRGVEEPFDYVISLCDRVREVCPEFPSHPDLIHWSIPDPARPGETDAQTYPARHSTTEELARRIPFLLELIDSTQTLQEVS